MITNKLSRNYISEKAPIIIKFNQRVNIIGSYRSYSFILHIQNLFTGLQPRDVSAVVAMLEKRTKPMKSLSCV